MRILLQERLSEDFWMGIMGRKEGGIISKMLGKLKMETMGTKQKTQSH